MINKKVLRGLPHDVVQSYLSTLAYSSPGYMEDWVYNWMNSLRVSEMRIDILSQTIYPTDASDPLKYFLPPLKNILERKLLKHSMSLHCIAEARMTFVLLDKDQKRLQCSATIVDTEKNRYDYEEMCSPSMAFDPSMEVIKRQDEVSRYERMDISKNENYSKIKTAFIVSYVIVGILIIIKLILRVYR